MMKSMISPEKAGLLQDREVFDQIKGELAASSIQSYKKAKKQFLKKRGQIITNLNNLNSGQITKSCYLLLANTIKEIVQNRQKKQIESKIFYKLLQQKLKERNLTQHPLYEIQYMLCDIQQQINMPKTYEHSSDINKIIVKNQFEQIVSKLNNINLLNKQNQSQNQPSNSLNINIQGNNINYPLSAQKKACLGPKQNSKSQDVDSDSSQMNLDDDEIQGESRNTVAPNQQKQTTQPIVKKAEESKQQQAKEPNKTINKLQKVQKTEQNKKEIKPAPIKQKNKKHFTNDSDDQLSDNDIFNGPSKQKQAQKTSKIEDNNLNKQQMIKPKEQMGNQINNSYYSKNQSFTGKDQKKQSIKTKQAIISKKQNKKQDIDDDMEIISEQDFQNECKSNDKKEAQIPLALEHIKIDQQTNKTIAKQVNSNNERVSLFKSDQGQMSIFLRDSTVGGIKSNNNQSIFSKLQTNDKQKATSIFGQAAIQKKSIFGNPFQNIGKTIFTQPQQKIQKQTNSCSNNQANKFQSLFSIKEKQQIKDQSTNIFASPKTSIFSELLKNEKQPENKFVPSNLFTLSLDTAKLQAPNNTLNSPNLFGGPQLKSQKGGLFGNSIFK